MEYFTSVFAYCVSKVVIYNSIYIDGLNNPTWRDIRPGSCKQTIPSSFCESPTPPETLQGYHKDLTCHCRCSKVIKLNIFVIYQIFNQISQDVSNFGDVMTFVISDIVKISYADLFADPKMNEGNETLIAHGGIYYYYWGVF